jgi:type I restriction enzyme S subunit
VSFPRYPEYKDSGVEWLGEVPAHWEVTRIGRLFEIQKRIAGELGHDVLSITQRGIQIKDTESNDGQLSMDYSKYQIVEVGDFAMNHMDLITGFVDVAKIPGVTSPDYRVFRLRDNSNSNSRFFLAVFQDAYRRKLFFPFGQGSSQLGRWRLPTDAFKQYPIPVPPATEQSAIAAFLARETAKIDTLVAEQEKLIALLKEKRQAVISHSVTKGLDPTVPMKNSGVEWLGEVPAHWKVKRLRFVADLNPSKSEIAELSRDAEISFLPMEAIGDDGRLNLDRTRLIGDVESGYTYFREGDVTIAKITPCFENGKGAVMRGLVGGIGFGTTELVVTRPREQQSTSEYLHWLFVSTPFRKLGEAAMYGAGGQKRTPDDFVRDFAIAFPDVKEQAVIAVFLDRETAKLDVLTGEAEKGIALLKERRSALISAAVTGKIDVRGFAERSAA